MDANGSIITASDEIMRSFQRNNAIRQLPRLEFVGAYKPDNVLKAIQDHEKTAFEVKFAGEKYYVVAKPVSEESLRMNDWYILNIVPTKTIRAETAGISMT